MKKKTGVQIDLSIICEYRCHLYLTQFPTRALQSACWILCQMTHQYTTVAHHIGLISDFVETVTSSGCQLGRHQSVYYYRWIYSSERWMLMHMAYCYHSMITELKVGLLHGFFLKLYECIHKHLTSVWS